VSGQIAIAGAAADNVALARVEVAVDGGPYQAAQGLSPWTFQLDTTQLANALHAIHARAVDTNGNVSPVVTVNVNVNNQVQGPTKAIPGTMLVRYITTDGAAADMPTYDTILLSGSRLPDLQSVKTASPGTRVLAYADPAVCTMNTTTDPGPLSTPAGWNSPIDKAEALAWDGAHGSDQWLLYDAATGGSPIPARGYPKDFLANLGSLTYQQQVVAKLQATIASGSPADFDGVFLDEINPNYLYRSGAVSPYNVLGYATPPGGGTPRVAVTDAAWKTKMLALLAYVYAHLGDTGLNNYVAINSGVSGDNDGSQTNTWWDQCHVSTDLLFQEYFEQYPGNLGLQYQKVGDLQGYFLQWLSNMDNAYSHGKHFAGGGHGAADAAKMGYIKAAFLLKWDGIDGGMFWMGAGVATLNSSYLTWIGSPNQGPYFTVGTNGYQRFYSNGVVCLNANPPGGASITFNLGANYKTPAGATVSSVTLAPVTAMTLTA
jgi:hypothetical protein